MVSPGRIRSGPHPIALVGTRSQKIRQSVFVRRRQKLHGENEAGQNEANAIGRDQRPVCPRQSVKRPKHKAENGEEVSPL